MCLPSVFTSTLWHNTHFIPPQASRLLRGKQSSSSAEDQLPVEWFGTSLALRRSWLAALCKFGAKTLAFTVTSDNRVSGAVRSKASRWLLKFLVSWLEWNFIFLFFFLRYHRDTAPFNWPGSHVWVTQDVETSLSFGLFYFQIIVGKIVGVYWAHVNATGVFQLLAFKQKIKK